MNKNYTWLLWAKELQAIAQIGLTYSPGEFDQIRYKRLQEIAAEILAHQSFESFETIKEIFAQEKYYLTPKLDVRTAIIQGNKILLVQEASDGKWTMPGGFADVNESPSESAIKEVFEESGYVVVINKLYALIDKQKHQYPPQIPHTYKCFFLGKIVGGHAKTSVETSGVAFFDRHELPELSLHRTMKADIDLAFEHYHHFELPTSFD